MMRRFVVRRSDECGSIVRDGVVIDHTWDVFDRVTGRTAANRDTRKQAREDADEYNRIAATPCARAMGCLCAGHARGNAPDAPCDTSEVAPDRHT